jgi:hypothetical protein
VKVRAAVVQVSQLGNQPDKVNQLGRAAMAVLGTQA